MRLYVDTSVWGGIDDIEFKHWTKLFFEQVDIGKYTIVLSDITLNELEFAPKIIHELLHTVAKKNIEIANITDEHFWLAHKYVESGAFTPKYYTDAQHIAMSSILKVDYLLSWNYKHMVNFFRIRQYNLINHNFGYTKINIVSPKELLYDKE